MIPFPSTLAAIFVSSVVLVATGYGYGHKHGAQTVQAKWDSEKVVTIAAQREKETELQSNMDTLRKAYNNETAKLAATVRTLALSLRNRPKRPSLPAVPASASAGDAGGWCSGPQLYREDAQLALSEAERADTIRLALITCQKAYKDAADKSTGH